jgi:putative oxidoreductase
MLLPLLNQGELAVLYCVFFLYLVFAGAGAWSVDARRKLTRLAAGASARA